jgi:hypothetical protein
MRAYNDYRLQDEPLEDVTVTPRIDCWSLDVGSLTAVVADVTDTIDIDLQLEVSNAPPSSTSTEWQPPEVSWFPVGEAANLTDNGSKLLKFDGFIGARWARLKATRNTGTGGAITVYVFLKGLG